MAAYYKVDVVLNSQAVSVGLPSPQSVSVTLPLVGPAGPQGAAGAAGATGAQGPQGAPGTGLEVLTTQGDLLYQGASTGQRLPIGTSGQVLKVSGGIPEWGAESGAVSSVAGRTGDVTLALADITDAGTAASRDDDYFATYGLDQGGQVEYARALADFVDDSPALSFENETVNLESRFQSSFRTALGLGDSATADIGTGAGDVCEGNDARLSDDRDPNLHAASHLPDGADEIFDQSLNEADDVEFNKVVTNEIVGALVAAKIDFTTGTFVDQNELDVFSWTASEDAVVFYKAIQFSGGNAEENREQTRIDLGLGDAAVEDTTAFAASGSITSSGLTQSTARILGRTSSSTGAVEEIQIGSGLSLSSGELSATGGGGEVRSDFVSPYTYTGLADAGTSESTASWLIRRSEFDAGGSFVATLTASAVQWANRLTASYA